MSELKRCPFCGGEARLQKPYRKRGWYVICKNTNCGCRTPFYQHLYTSEDDLQTIATMVWNNRKPMERIVERLKNELLESINKANDEMIDNGHTLDFEHYFGEKESYEKAIEIVKEEGGMNER